MTQTYVALDLETTGLDPVHDRITEIAAVRFTPDGCEIERYEQLVNPGRDIPLFIEQFTGVTNEAVRNAPRVASVAVDLRRFIGQDPVVGHNVGFDLNCLAREGVALGVSGIDTAQLSRYLLPGPQSRGLVDLAALLGVEAGVHHRALSDARTAAAIFTALLRRAEELPDQQRFQLARFVSMNDLALAEIIGGREWSTALDDERHTPMVRPPHEYTALVRKEPRQPVLRAELDRAFAAAGDVVEGFEEREEQRQMAEAVRNGLTDGGHWLIEAGTGVGKSLAYLLPAALHAIRNGERVVVSTNTINLQEQLLTKDIPALREILLKAGVIKEGSEFRASLLKGRSNYLCLKRWIANYGSGLGDPEFARLGSSMLLWLPGTETGDRGELSLDHDEWLAWPRFSAQETDCLSKQNSYVREGTCFLQRARKSAETAHILVVNHALLLADVASGGNALPQFDHLIVDEAHNLEDQATKQFGGAVSRRTLTEALEGLHRRGSRDHREGGVATLLRAMPEGAVPMLGKALEESVARTALLAAPLFEALAAMAPHGGDDDRLLVTRAVRTREEWGRVEEAWGVLEKALRETANRAVAAMKAVSEAPVESAETLAGEVETAVRKVDEVATLLKRLMSITSEDTIVWVARERDQSGSLNSAPLDVGPTLWEELFAKRRTVIATSATLSAAGSMEFAARRLGLEQPRTLQLGSPFDYQSATLLTAFTDLPEPNDRAYAGAIGEAIVKLVTASNGRALALFTSNAALRQAADFARPALEKAGIAVLAQGVDGSPKQLTDHLQRNPRTAIFGTSSFWEGVDVKGDALSMLIIARLPFGVPSDPIYKARSEQYDNPFQDYALPGAILRFRQGFGRLIRARDDSGVVAVLDRRIWEKQYGKTFVQALPKCTQFRSDAGSVAERAREWLAR